MHIVFAAAECVPFASTGGLSEVVAALPRELVKLGHQVTVYLPLYRSVQSHLPEERIVAVQSITIPFVYYNRFVGIVDGGLRDGVQFYFVDCPELFDRDGLYGPASGVGDYPDNAERFGLFCRAVLEATKLLGVPDVFHVHDWHTALRHTATVLTVHNAGYQGAFPAQTTPQLLLPWDMFTPDRLEHNGFFNFLQGGLIYADFVTTVSPTYAREIQTAEFGSGLEATFRRRQSDLRGILNGIDVKLWDPAHDPKLAAHYSSEDLSGKAECRRDMLHAFGLDDVADATPILGIASRLVAQKGFDFLAQIADELLSRNVALAVLGDGEPYYENLFRNLAAHHSDRVGVLIKYDEALLHKVEAGSDIFLMPSRYEPCGLNQMYSLKYGTVPIVRATGGLEDTVEEWNPEAKTGTGFKFHGYEPPQLLAAIDRALGAFADKEGWQTLMRNGMAKDFSWEASAKEYAQVYEEVSQRRG